MAFSHREVFMPTTHPPLKLHSKIRINWAAFILLVSVMAGLTVWRVSARYLNPVDPKVTQLQHMRMEYNADTDPFQRMVLSSYILSVASSTDQTHIPKDLSQFIDDLRETR
jgi:hypothetical protein